jgi:hypothetical protein
MNGAISGDERRHPSGGEDELGRDEVIGAHQSSSEAIRAHRSSSELIRAHRSSSELIRAHQSSSEDVLGRDALHGLGDCEGFYRRGERIALREHMWRGVTKPIETVLALRVIGWVMSAPDEACNRASPHECAATRRRLAPASAVVCFCGIVTGSAGISSRGAHGFRHGAPMGFVTGRPWVSSVAIIRGNHP